MSNRIESEESTIMFHHNINTFINNLIWLLDLSNDEISGEMREELNIVISFLYENKLQIFSSKEDYINSFLDILDYKIGILGNMRREHDMKRYNERIIKGE